MDVANGYVRQFESKRNRRNKKEMKELNKMYKYKLRTYAYKNECMYVYPLCTP